MKQRPKDHRLIGFIVGFGGVTLIGLIVMVGWGVLSNAPAPPTLVASVVPVAERATVAPLAGELAPAEGAAMPSPPASDLSTPLPAPSGPPPNAAQTQPEPIQYTVRAGDTLFEIALAHGVSVEALQAANDLQGETIVPNQVLVIPTGPLPTPTPHIEG
jgi:nucleoid-associated protein YgaU